MSSTTTKDLQHAFTRLDSELRNSGSPLAGRLVLAAGSKTYGRAYRLHAQHDGSTAHHNVPGLWNGGFLGMTKSEAVQSLDMLCAGIRMAAVTADYFAALSR